MALMPNKRLALLTTLIFSFLFAASANSLHGQSWQIDQQWQSSCMFESDRELDPSCPACIPNAAPDLLSPAIQQISGQISIGMVQANHAAGSARVSPQSLVDLHVVVSNSVDDQLTAGDNYWGYYLDCDRWEVVFNAIQPTEAVLVTAEENRVVRSPFEIGYMWLLKTHDDILAAYESATFATIENMASAESVLEDEVVFPASEPVQPITMMLNSIQHPAVEILKDLHETLDDKYQYLENLSSLATQLTAPIDEGS